MTATLYPTRHATRPGEINYAARRALAVVVVVVALALGAVAVSAMVAAIADVGGRPAAASDTMATVAAAWVPRVHVAQPGDTLWSIADRYRGEVGHGRFVDALIDVNGGPGIQVGQAVRLP